MVNDRHTNLKRLLSPSTLAVVGANEKLGMSNNAVLPMIEAGRKVHLINPTRETLYGEPALKSLTEAGTVDAVLAIVNAERSVDTVEEAAALGCGGVVVAAAGFSEAGESGAELNRRLQDVAARTGIAVIGPNCSGFKNVPLGVNLFTGGRLEVPSGGVAIVSQSGFLVRSCLAAAIERRIGVSIAVSSGNESVCDLADYVSVLADHDGTNTICLVIETVRRPKEFFEAVAKARSAGKAVIALKLGRTDRSRRIMQSHTGAIADASWVYDMAFREHGIVGVKDMDSLLDSAILLSQLPADQRKPVSRIGIITTSGGVAASATDIAEDEGIDLPSLEEIEDWVRERVPGDTVNPLDLTGFVMSQPEVMKELFARYANAVDLLVLAWWAGHDDEGWSKTLLEPFAEVAKVSNTPFFVSPLEATGVGEWTDAWRDRGLHFARGIQSIYRAAHAITAATARARGAVQPVAVSTEAKPTLVATEIGNIATFAAAMKLLEGAGVRVAPYVVLDEGQSVDDSFLDEVGKLGDKVVVKLADVPHRTELGAVRVGVAQADVTATVAQMREIAKKHGVSDAIAVQKMITGFGEAFVGINGTTDLGPTALLGAGGVLVEVGGGVKGRFLPLSDEAQYLADEVVEAIAGLRGQKRWPIDEVVNTLKGLDAIWATTNAWLASADINPLIVNDEGLWAVDALLVAR